MSKYKNHVLRGLFALPLAVLTATQVMAQTTEAVGTGGNETAGNQGLEEIIVTAQKRSEKIDEVPMSITAVSGDQLKEQQVRQPSDLEKVVPGFTYQQSTYGPPIFTIRGIGFFDISLANAPTVSIYVDQVPLPYSIMTEGATLDLERVEVLKGPQGTLFGENSTGGAINYIAKKPTNTFDAGATLSFGRFDSTDMDGFISGPLTDTLKGRVAIRTEQEGVGWQQSETRSDTLGYRNFTTGRGLLDWDPTDWLTMEFNANGWIDGSDTQAYQFVKYAPLGTGNSAPAKAILPVYTSPAPQNDSVADWDAGRGFRKNNSLYQLSLRGDAQLGDGLTLTSITSYSHLEAFIPTDDDGTAFHDYVMNITGRIDDVTQELRLSGDAIDQSLRWMVGGNYEHDDTLDHQKGDFNNSDDVIGPYTFTTNINGDTQNVDTEAVFGSLDYQITPEFSAQTSLRYTRDSREFAGCLQDAGDGNLADSFSFIANELGANPAVHLAPGSCVTLTPGTNQPYGIVFKSINDHNLSWHVGLTWKPDDNTHIYATITQGYKAGSFPSIAAIRPDQYDPNPPESLLAYETGFKLSAMDRKLHLDGALFYYDYTDKQILGYINTGSPFFNLPAGVSIPKSSVRGAELEATWRPIPVVTFRLGTSYIDSRVDKSFITDDPFGSNIDVKGESFPNTPRWQFVGDAEYDFPINSNLEGFVGTSFRYRTQSNAAFGGGPLFVLPAYGLVDLRAGVDTADGHWHVELWGQNITNQYYLVDVSHPVDTVIRATGMPATYGFTLGYRF